MAHPPLWATALTWTICFVLIQLILLWTPMVCGKTHGNISRVQPPTLRKACCIMLCAAMPLLMLLAMAREIAKAFREITECAIAMPADMARAWAGRL